jgi:hypothetical protein
MLAGCLNEINGGSPSELFKLTLQWELSGYNPPVKNSKNFHHSEHKIVQMTYFNTRYTLFGSWLYYSKLKLDIKKCVKEDKKLFHFAMYL